MSCPPYTTSVRGHPQLLVGFTFPFYTSHTNCLCSTRGQRFRPSPCTPLPPRMGKSSAILRPGRSLLTSPFPLFSALLLRRGGPHFVTGTFFHTLWVLLVPYVCARYRLEVIFLFLLTCVVRALSGLPPRYGRSIPPLPPAPIPNSVARFPVFCASGKNSRFPPPID